MIDYLDVLVAIGVLLLGVAIGIIGGWPGLLGYFGTVLIIVAGALAWRRGRRAE